MVHLGEAGLTMQLRGIRLVAAWARYGHGKIPHFGERLILKPEYSLSSDNVSVADREEISGNSS